MKENKLELLSMDLAVKVVRIHRNIQRTYDDRVVGEQFLRSGTAVGSNVRQLSVAVNKADFVTRLHVAMKAVTECEYWLELLQRTEYISREESQDLMIQLGTVKNIIMASIQAAKKQPDQAQ